MNDSWSIGKGRLFKRRSWFTLLDQYGCAAVDDSFADDGNVLGILRIEQHSIGNILTAVGTMLRFHDRKMLDFVACLENGSFVETKGDVTLQNNRS